MDLLSKGITPSSGEMTNWNITDRFPVCFGRLRPPPTFGGHISYDIDYIMDNYSGKQQRRSSFAHPELDKEDFERKYPFRREVFLAIASD